MPILFLCAAGLLLAAAVVACLNWRQRQKFNERFPPITDAEFVARCKPGTDPDVALRVRRVLADCLGEEYERIYPSTNFIDDLLAD